MRWHKLAGVILVLVLSLSLVFAACAPAPGEQPPEEQPVRLTISGGSIGGMLNTGASLIAAIAKKYQGIDSTVIIVISTGQATAIAERTADIAMSYSYLNMDAYTGTGISEGLEPAKDLRLLGYYAEAGLNMMVRVDSDIRDFRDLIGKRISPGKRGFTADRYLELISEAFGLSYEDDFSMEYLGHKDGGAALTAGKIDAYLVSSDPPHPTWGQIDLTTPIRLVGFTEEDLQTFLEKWPGFLEMEIPAENYHMDVPVKTFGSPGCILTSTDLPEDMAYGIVKYFHEDTVLAGYYHSEFQKFLESGKARYYAEHMRDVPYHIGAVRYFKEVGWNIPPERILPE